MSRKKERFPRFNEAEHAALLEAIPQAHVFHPTEAEFAEGPFAYVKAIRSRAEETGICCIVAPKSYHAPFQLSEKDMLNACRVPCKAQQARGKVGDQGCNFAAQISSTKCKKRRRLRSLKNSCSALQRIWAQDTTSPSVEQKYWNWLSGGGKTLYASDVEPQDFPSTTPRHAPVCGGWDLRNLRTAPDSILRCFAAMPGITEPMLYIASMFATFAWHLEDNFLYSVSYQHFGEERTWYGVPGAEWAKVDKTFKAVFPGLSKAHPTLPCLKTSMFSPALLMSNKVKVFRLTQRPGDFIITFPKAYHAGFSHGFSVSESVNFAPLDWLLAAIEWLGAERPSAFPSQEILFRYFATRGLPRLVSAAERRLEPSEVASKQQRPAPRPPETNNMTPTMTTTRTTTTLRKLRTATSSTTVPCLGPDSTTTAEANTATTSTTTTTTATATTTTAAATTTATTAATISNDHEGGAKPTPSLTPTTALVAITAQRLERKRAPSVHASDDDSGDNDFYDDAHRFGSAATPQEHFHVIVQASHLLTKLLNTAKKNLSPFRTQLSPVTVVSAHTYTRRSVGVVAEGTSGEAVPYQTLVEPVPYCSICGERCWVGWVYCVCDATSEAAARCLTHFQRNANALQHMRGCHARQGRVMLTEQIQRQLKQWARKRHSSNSNALPPPTTTAALATPLFLPRTCTSKCPQREEREDRAHAESTTGQRKKRKYNERQ